LNPPASELNNRQIELEALGVDGVEGVGLGEGEGLGVGLDEGEGLGAGVGIGKAGVGVELGDAVGVTVGAIAIDRRPKPAIAVTVKTPPMIQRPNLLDGFIIFPFTTLFPLAHFQRLIFSSIIFDFESDLP
jgi:hypothetical protein